MKKASTITTFILLLLLITLTACKPAEAPKPDEEREDARVDIIDKLAQNSSKYGNQTKGLEGDQKLAVIGVLDFYFLLQTNNFKDIPSTLSESIPQDPSTVASYYEQVYKENGIDLQEVDIKTIELDKTSEDSIVIKVELKETIKGVMHTQTDEVTMRKDSDGQWRVYQLQLVKK